MTRLRAKSWNSVDGPVPTSVFLPDHLSDVVACAEAIVDATGVAQLRAFGVDPSSSLSRFRKLAVLAAACHDLGKANNQFQAIVSDAKKTSTGRQAVRHEWVSWYILQDADLKNWLYDKLEEPTREIDWHILLWSITGHHPAFGREIPSKCPPGSTDKMELMLGHEDFTLSLQCVAKTLGTSQCPIRLRTKTVSVEGEIYEFIRDSLADAHSKWEKWSKELETSGILASIKNTLVAADVAGSALPNSSFGTCSRSEWKRVVHASLSVAPTVEEFSQLIDDRLTLKGEKHVLKDFQLEVAARESEVTLVKAGCGSGKTLAAYHWVRERFPGKRLYVCYPTTGTATEGFRDYLFDASEHQPKFGAELFHGRSDIDSQIILETASEDTESKDIESNLEALDRIRSLKSWAVPIVSCTVDTVLGIIHNQRRAIYSWPALCNAAFVFDEIHSYDASMFSALLAFLKRLPGIPVLLMTASLPENRLEKLKNSVRCRANGLVEIPGPPELESLKRYRHWKQPSKLIVDVVSEEIKAQGKVLWVSNTVKRTMEAYHSCSHIASGETVYHSRFRYIDRVKRHKAVINQFSIENASAIAWTSQVAELSLDLSATLLITDLAPIPALIQRLGRLNRKAEPPSAAIMPFIVIEPIDDEGAPQVLPYRHEQLKEAREWLTRLPAEIAQQDLIHAWQGLGLAAEKQLSSESTWIDGGYDREVKEIRDGSPGVHVILESDVDLVRSGERTLLEVIIPMNQPRGMHFDNRPKYQGIVVVDETVIQYSELLGGEWI